MYTAKLSIDPHDECVIRPEIQKIFDSMEYKNWQTEWNEEYKMYILKNKNNNVAIEFLRGISKLFVNNFRIDLNCKETNLLISGLKKINQSWTDSWEKHQKKCLESVNEMDLCQQ